MEDAGVPLRSTHREGSTRAGASPCVPQLREGDLEGLDVSFCLILMLEIPTFLFSGFAGSLTERTGCCGSAGWEAVSWRAILHVHNHEWSAILSKSPQLPLGVVCLAFPVLLNSAGLPPFLKEKEKNDCTEKEVNPLFLFPVIVRIFSPFFASLLVTFSLCQN